LYGAETAEGAARDLAQPRQQEEDRLGPRMLVGERKSHRSSPQVIGQSLDQPALSMRAEAAAQRRRSELLPARTKDLRPLGEILGPGARPSGVPAAEESVGQGEGRLARARHGFRPAYDAGRNTEPGQDLPERQRLGGRAARR